MHPDDASSRGVVDGDVVEVFNARGRIRLTARVSANGHTSVPAGVVASRLSWNKLSPGGHNVNLLTSQRLTDIGGGPTFYSTLVEVRKAAPQAGP
jgi:anaerobic selenocysteine-containing dehydrogenase